LKKSPRGEIRIDRRHQRDGCRRAKAGGPGNPGPLVDVRDPETLARLEEKTSNIEHPTSNIE